MSAVSKLILVLTCFTTIGAFAARHGGDQSPSPKSGNSAPVIKPMKLIQVPKASCFAVSSDNKWIVTGDDAGIKVWDIKTGNNVKSLIAGSAVTTLAWHPTNAALIVSGHQDGSIKYWSMDHDNCLQPITLEQPVQVLAWSPEGTYLAAGSGKTVTIWSIDINLSHKELTKMQATDDSGTPVEVRYLAFNNAGEFLAIGGRSPFVVLWKKEVVARGKYRWACERCLDNGSGVTSLNWSRDGQTLAAGGFSYSVRLWKKNGDWRKDLTYHGCASACSVVWRDNLLASCDGATIKIWEQDKCLQTFEQGEVGKDAQIVWSNNGKYLISLADKTTIRIWMVADELLKINAKRLVPATTPKVEKFSFATWFRKNWVVTSVLCAAALFGGWWLYKKYW